MEFTCLLIVLLVKYKWIISLFKKARAKEYKIQAYSLMLNHTFMFLGLLILFWYYSWYEISFTVLVFRSLTFVFSWFLWNKSIDHYYN